MFAAVEAGLDGYIPTDLTAQIPHAFTASMAQPLSPSHSIVSMGVSGTFNNSDGAPPPIPSPLHCVAIATLVGL